MKAGIRDQVLNNHVHVAVHGDVDGHVGYGYGPRDRTVKGRSECVLQEERLIG